MSYDKLQGFFESPTGQIISVAVLVILFAGVLLSGRKQKTNTKTMVVSALLVGLSIVLTRITIWSLPQGGSVSLFGMLPIVICAYFFGTRRAVMCGMCVGMIDLIFKPYVIHPIQLLLDYPLAFGAIGFAGLIFMAKKDGLIPAYLFGVLCRYICAVISGVVFFGAYAPEGFSALTWSLWYNVLYLAIEAAGTVILLLIPSVRHSLKRIKTELQV
ncbi:MAG: energy-coupled thiamine transporter ThiT [Clostridia bacterium]|nr:energy-coupled thiamine transporter ThiT [Clostridia bacterium]